MALAIYFLALFLTIVVEFIVVWSFVRIRILGLFCYSCLINCCTQPVANSFYHWLIVHTTASWLSIALGIELLVFAIESLLWMLLLEIRLKKAIQLSFWANLCTALLSCCFA